MDDKRIDIFEQPNDFEMSFLDPTVIESLEKWDRDDKRLAINTIKVYSYTIAEFNEFLVSINQKVNVDSIWRYMEHIRLTQAPASYNLKRQALKKVLKAQPSIRNNLLLLALINELFFRIKRVKEECAIMKDEYLTLDEIKELIAVSSPVYALIIEFLFKTGLRVSEMINIRLQDIELSDHCKIRIVGKGNKIRYCFINLQLYEKIISLITPSEFLFETLKHGKLHRVNVSYRISLIGKKIDKKIHAHTLRHSCIMHLLNYKNLKYVSKYAGHSTSAITADMYVHENPDSEVIDFFNMD